jgi:hypothetical protein
MVDLAAVEVNVILPLVVAVRQTRVIQEETQEALLTQEAEEAELVQLEQTHLDLK